ncbi:Ras family small GTPase (macronuclear) [Tetrahymena thermophila SB210]|uniref:Ras family small GTPase n=2 Tax=Tetrahymena thermophila TaxID=5911 RepID=I7MM63_TETTS|nr:Ras family small GTPase [Tetrahymena thermophila SB210]EAS04240.3 Ras family small GTPase [Tetrahymena thermophila SB210]|eukprot:XP_001024485.3 Ras family small GTPase [Tetrahymena thermophila SB210]
MYTTNGQTFLKDYNMTQAAEVSSKIIPFPEKDKDVELFFFDISGQDCYQSITSELLGQADLLVLVYDCTSQESYNKLQTWYDKVKQKNSKSLQGVLISTKNDLSGARQVDPQQARDLAKKLNLQFFEVSSARNTNIDLPFQNLAERLV